MMNNGINSNNFNASLISMSSLKPDKYTADGLIVSLTHPNANQTDATRYINPKMERELIQFKIKIAARYEAGQIPKDFSFPRSFNNNENQTKIFDQEALVEESHNDSSMSQKLQQDIGTEQRFRRQQKSSRLDSSIIKGSQLIQRNHQTASE